MNLVKKYKGELILILASILWGSCFVFQKKGMDYMGPYTLGAFRFLLGGFALLPILLFIQKKEKTSEQTLNLSTRNTLDLTLYKGGILCGVVLFAGASLQQIGLQYTTAGKAGFITSLEIVFVAVIMVFITRKITKSALASVLLAIIGMYLLSMVNGFVFQKGDTYELFGVIFWSLQILLIDYFSKKVNVIKLSFVQFITTGMLSLIFMFVFEHPELHNILQGTIPILYTAIIEVAIAYTLQIIGQKYTPPITASVLLSLEAVFAAIAGVVLLNELMTTREMIGCTLMFLAVLVSQIPEAKNANIKVPETDIRIL